MFLFHPALLFYLAQVQIGFAEILPNCPRHSKNASLFGYPIHSFPVQTILLLQFLSLSAPAQKNSSSSPVYAPDKEYKSGSILADQDRKSTRLNSSHVATSYA